jgi:hypothetical protein
MREIRRVVQLAKRRAIGPGSSLSERNVARPSGTLAAPAQAGSRLAVGDGTHIAIYDESDYDDATEVYA